MDRKSIPQLWLNVLVALVAIVSSGRGQSRDRALADPHAQAAAPKRLKAPGGASCSQFCHASEVEGYTRSAMAHSLRRAGQEPDGTVDTPDAKITMYSSPTGYWQRLQSGGDVTDFRVDYVIGSGNHASG